MPIAPTISESAIRSLATAQSYSRGEDYYLSNAVGELQRRGDTLLAEVEGSSYEPYRVTIELDAGGVQSAECTCPYDWGGACKHIVAVLLAYAGGRHQIEERPTVRELLADLDRGALHALLVDLLESRPALIDWAEARLAVQRAQAKTAAPPAGDEEPRQRRTPIDTQAIRRQVRYQVQAPDYRDYGATGGVVSALQDILDQARQFLDGGDGDNALAIIAVIANETIPGWEMFDDSDGEFGDFFYELGRVAAEAILTADLAANERKAWIEQFEAWQAELGDYGIDDFFEVAIAAARQDWDDESLQRALQGRSTELGAWADEAPGYADELALARLNVLERQGRSEEYLNLAQAEGQTQRYLTMLVKVGRAEEAVSYPYLVTAAEALALAQALRDHGHPLMALQVAERGLNLTEPRVALAFWLRNFAAGVGDAALAFKAARIAFEENPGLDNYRALEALAGAGWPAARQELLGRMAEGAFAYGAIDIYLHEGMIDQAVAAVDARPYVGYDTVERVVDAALETYPDWAIRQCRLQAEPIMDEGKSKYYHHAARWLEKAKRAYLAAGREREWRAYCQGLLDKHGRKYSLAPKLRALL